MCNSNSLSAIFRCSIGLVVLLSLTACERSAPPPFLRKYHKAADAGDADAGMFYRELIHGF